MVEIRATSGGLGAPHHQRSSSWINRKPASNLHHSVALAKRIGLPFTHFITINFSRTNCRPEEVSACFARIRITFGFWVRRPSRNSNLPAAQPTYAWTIEAVGNMAVHMLVHIPDGRAADLTDRLYRWLEKVTGGVHDASAIHVEPAYNPVGARRYMMKGIDPHYAAFYGIDAVPQGTVQGRRSGFSRNVGPTVRRRLISEGRYHRSPRGMGAAGPIGPSRSPTKERG